MDIQAILDKLYKDRKLCEVALEKAERTAAAMQELRKAAAGALECATGAIEAIEDLDKLNRNPRRGRPRRSVTARLSMRASKVVRRVS